jgi:pyruvate dehydrogenase E2 component (dihydrolipoamide acetyltransferase)
MIEITIPKLGLTMESAKLVEWAFVSGDKVREGETILVIETDKVTFEVPAPADGIIHPVVPEGADCEVEETVGYLAEDREEYERIIKECPGAVSKGSGKAETCVSEVIFPEGRPGPDQSPLMTEGRIKASPLARSMAVKHDLDLRAIAGSGPSGRIVKADIVRALKEKPVVADRFQKIPLSAADRASADKTAVEAIPVEGVRRVIFDNMYESLSRTAQLTLHTDACAEALMDVRGRLNKGDHKISYNAVLTKIAAMALRLHPNINASVEGNSILIWAQVHIGIAMEANDALIVPVVRNPDLKTVSEIDHDITELILKTRENRLSPDDLANGTFTITNLGSADIDHFTPIIKPPESAILGVGRIVKKPGIKNDQVVPEARIGLSLTFDHRIIDGAPAAVFLKTIKDTIEDPLLMIV